MSLLLKSIKHKNYYLFLFIFCQCGQMLMNIISKLVKFINIQMSSSNLQSENGFLIRTFPNLSNLEGKQSMVNILNSAQGVNIFGRYTPALDYLQKSEKDNLAVETRGLQSEPSHVVTATDQNNVSHFGSNFASNNYLGLNKHSSTVEAATQAANTFGVNSAGSPLAFGATKYYMQLKEEIGQFWNCKTLIYSSGWLAGYGIKALIKDYDHVIIDEFSQNPLFEGAYAATKNVYKNRHLDEKHIEELLTTIRSKDKENGIFVITEALFPLDSASPNLVHLQQLTKKHQGFLAIGCGHDFGVIGENGRGVWQQQNLQDRSNVLLVGTGSKTTSINYGFIGCTNPNVPQYMKYYSASYMFTNAINPVQANCALATLRIIKSQQGKNLRKQVLQNCNYLREKLSQKGYSPLGRASGFVCVRVGDEVISRIIVRMLMDNEIHVNNVEYPLAPKGQAVIRFALSPHHQRTQMDQLVSAFDFFFKKAKTIKENASKTVKPKL